MKMKLKGQTFDTVEEIEVKTDGTKHPNKERLPGCISEVAETLGSVCALQRALV
jgi:hypothetical protein